MTSQAAQLVGRGVLSCICTTAALVWRSSVCEEHVKKAAVLVQVGNKRLSSIAW